MAAKPPDVSEKLPRHKQVTRGDGNVYGEQRKSYGPPCRERGNSTHELVDAPALQWIDDLSFGVHERDRRESPAFAGIGNLGHHDLQSARIEPVVGVHDVYKGPRRQVDSLVDRRRSATVLPCHEAPR